jgi:neutral ceramidase
MAGYGRRVGRSTAIHDALAAQAIVLSDGERKAAMVCVDVLALGVRICESVAAGIAAATDIAADAVMVCATHTHSGPQFNLFATPGPDAARTTERDLNWERALPEKIARSAIEANSRLRPALIAAASAPFAFGTNRRLMRTDGTIQLAPNYAGVADQELNVLGAFDASSGEPIAFLLNYPCHGVVLCEDNLLYSRDWPGFSLDELERRFRGSIALFAQGASGNIDPRRRGSFDFAREAGCEAAANAVRALEHANRSRPAHLATRRVPLRLKLRDLNSRLTLARANVAQTEAAWKKHTGVAGAQLKRLTDQHQRSMEELGALQVLDDANRRDKRVDQTAGELTTHMTVLVAGDVALVGVPGELFAELGMAIRASAIFPHTFVLGYCNDLAGYFPTREAYDLGGYEVETSRVAAGSGELIVERAQSLLSEMRF